MLSFCCWWYCQARLTQFVINYIVNKMLSHKQTDKKKNKVNWMHVPYVLQAKSLNPICDSYQCAAAFVLACPPKSSSVHCYSVSTSQTRLPHTPASLPAAAAQQTANKDVGNQPIHFSHAMQTHAGHLEHVIQVCDGLPMERTHTCKTSSRCCPSVQIGMSASTSQLLRHTR